MPITDVPDRPEAAPALSIEGFAAVNAVAVCLWVYLSVRIAREHRKLRSGKER